jgi:hypothetical protein
VAEAVRPEYPELLRRFLLARRSALSRRMSPVNAFGLTHRTDLPLNGPWAVCRTHE